MEKRYVIYKVTNKINGKIYIGKTYNFEKRKREHLYDINNNLPFHRALKKYGIENFVWEIVDTANSDDEAREKESQWIKELNSCIHSPDSNGYNITIGGEGGVSWNSRLVLQFSMEGEFVDEYLSCACADYECGLYSGAVQRACQDLGSSCGYQWRYKDDVNSDSIPPYHRESSRKLEVVQADKYGSFIKEFISVTQASKELSLSRSNISSCLTGRSKTCGGFQWKYAEEFYKDGCGKIEGYDIKNEIVQLTKEYKFVSIHYNCRRAARAIGLERPETQYKMIHSALDKKSHYAHGFVWMRLSEYLSYQQGNSEISA